MSSKRERKLGARLEALKDKFVDLANDIEQHDPKLALLIDDWLLDTNALCERLVGSVS